MTRMRFYWVLLVLIIGSIAGGILNSLILFFLDIISDSNNPSIVYQFFKLNYPLVIDLNEFGNDILNFSFRLSFSFSVLSVVGMIISWYFLRYFRY